MEGKRGQAYLILLYFAISCTLSCTASKQQELKFLQPNDGTYKLIYII